MSVTEIVFPTFVDDSKLRQEIFDEFESITKRDLANLPGVLATFRAKILETHGPAGKGHGGFIPMLTWEKLESLMAFFNSPAFPVFQQSIGKYMAAKPTVKLFRSPEGNQSPPNVELLSQSSYLQIYLLSRPDGEVSEAEKVWTRFTEAVTSVAPAQAAPRFHHSPGVREEDPTLMGLVGWKELSALEDVNSDSKVKQAFENLQESLGPDKLSILTVDLLKMT